MGLKPDVVVLEVVPVGENWEQREIYWIKFQREAGMPLTNLTNGGDHGFCGRHSDEWKKNLSEKMKGNKHSTGHVWTKQERENHLLAVDREKRAMARAKDYPAFINEKTGQKIPAGKNLAGLCRSMGLTGATTHLVVWGKIRSHKGWILERQV